MNEHERRLAEIRQLNLQLRALSKEEPSEEKSSTMHAVREEMAGVLREASEDDRNELEALRQEGIDDLVSRMKKMEGEPEIDKPVVVESVPECLSLIEEESAGMDRQHCKLAEGHAESCSSKVDMKISSVTSGLNSNHIKVKFEDGSYASIDEARPFGDPESHWCLRFLDKRPEFGGWQFARMKNRDLAAGYASRFVCALLDGKPLGFWVDGWDYLNGDDKRGEDPKKLLKRLEGEMSAILFNIRAKEEELQRMCSRRDSLKVEISELKVKNG